MFDRGRGVSQSPKNIAEEERGEGGEYEDVDDDDGGGCVKGQRERERE